MKRLISMMIVFNFMLLVNACVPTTSASSEQDRASVTAAVMSATAVSAVNASGAVGAH